jgi:hypothetical protein
VLAAAERLADASLGKLELAPMHFVDLRKVDGAESPSPGPTLTGILQCPACTGSLDDVSTGLDCAVCGRHFPRNGAVLDLRHVGEVA